MDLKIQGYFIIGYCRKSKTTADNEKVTKCLQSMVLGLKERSLAQKVYVTVSCNAGTPFKKNTIIDQLSSISGNAQDLLQDIQKINKVALVIIDSAGLTTNFTDLEMFLQYGTYYKQSNSSTFGFSKNSNIQKIIIDTLIHDNQVHVINCQEK
ncbi:hypothetical protein BDB01DRAFT_23919 [Pilobolus umbonatus]|nr:hypothetical protein BDB01DRAFT_23919 [Pilobolus umbonatus]